MRLGFFLSEAFGSMRRNWVMAMAAVITVFISTAILGAVLVTRDNLNQGATSLKNRVMIEVFIKDDATRLNIGANCFPSMHTSVAYAILLLGLRERSRAFRWMMTVYATSIIISTMYMEVHWIVDVIGGIGLGHAAVILTDRVTRRWERPMLMSVQFLQA